MPHHYLLHTLHTLPNLNLPPLSARTCCVSCINWLSFFFHQLKKNLYVSEEKIALKMIQRFLHPLWPEWGIKICLHSHTENVYSLTYHPLQTSQWLMRSPWHFLVWHIICIAWFVNGNYRQLVWLTEWWSTVYTEKVLIEGQNVAYLSFPHISANLEYLHT